MEHLNQLILQAVAKKITENLKSERFKGIGEIDPLLEAQGLYQYVKHNKENETLDQFLNNLVLVRKELQEEIQRGAFTLKPYLSVSFEKIPEGAQLFTRVKNSLDLSYNRIVRRDRVTAHMLQGAIEAQKLCIPVDFNGLLYRQEAKIFNFNLLYETFPEEYKKAQSIL